MEATQKLVGGYNVAFNSNTGPSPASPIFSSRVAADFVNISAEAGLGAGTSPSAEPPNYIATSTIVEFRDCGHDDEITPHCTPSIFMPRWASRITLEITDVRVQRLHDISEEDAQGEGIEKLPYPGGPNFFTYLADRVWHSAPTAKECFADLWDSINAKRCPWSSNPWVWAVSFNVVRP